MKCCVCNFERDDAACITITLTEDEKAAIREMGQTPENAYVYCRPCFRILSNPEQGAQLIRGVFQQELQAEGMRNAEALASRYYNFLISKVRKGRPT